ncbi:hypothetical protein IscW_ISCW024621 [Ixodes scapularis]|uniref:Uncharacterized protein n=1 Tax=Ixodes scapularis TaxID=6945 RepID=B7Q8I0_IXOSC|nr:hypothetical protein IscW_ISCW024621 [Ixodes scapularis]|eukprot:XP_002405132.1 hypothetical protein IscW_ISCW024621 [Ixodes scapularis]
MTQACFEHARDVSGYKLSVFKNKQAFVHARCGCCTCAETRFARGEASAHAPTAAPPQRCGVRAACWSCRSGLPCLLLCALLPSEPPACLPVPEDHLRGGLRGSPLLSASRPLRLCPVIGLSRSASRLPRRSTPPFGRAATHSQEAHRGFRTSYVVIRQLVHTFGLFGQC